MGGDAGTEAQNIGEEVGGEFAEAAVSESGEIGGGNFQGGGGAAMSPGVQAVASGAILGFVGAVIFWKISIDRLYIGMVHSFLQSCTLLPGSPASFLTFCGPLAQACVCG